MPVEKESPADKIKREAAEKADQKKLDEEKAKLEAEAKEQEAAIAADAEHQAKVDEAARAAIDDDESDGEDEEQPARRPGQTFIPTADIDESEEAAKTLRQIAVSYPLTTPDSHVVFGFGGIKFSLGQLRALFRLQKGV